MTGMSRGFHRPCPSKSCLSCCYEFIYFLQFASVLEILKYIGNICNTKVHEVVSCELINNMGELF